MRIPALRTLSDLNDRALDTNPDDWDRASSNGFDTNSAGARNSGSLGDRYRPRGHGGRSCSSSSYKGCGYRRDPDNSSEVGSPVAAGRDGLDRGQDPPEQG